MMLFIKKVNFVVYLVVALVVGFGFGCLIRTNSIQDDLLAANIAKASLYNNQKEDPQLSIVEEKLKNDTEFRESTIEIMDLLKDRMAGLNELTERTLQTCSEIPDFIELNTTFASLQTKAYNTNLAIESATSGIEKIMNGESAPEYEVATNNVYIGYQKINKQLEAGKKFVDVAEEYLNNNMENENAPAVAELVTDWSVYCAEDAVLSGKDDEYAYWNERYDGVSGVLSKVDEFAGKQGELAGKQGELAGKQGELAGKQGELAGKQGELAGKQGELAGKQGELAGKQGELAGKQGELAGKQGELAGKQGELAGKMGGLASKQGELAGKQGELAGKQGELAGKQGELAGKMGGLASKMGDLANKQGNLANKAGDIASKIGNLVF